MLPAMSNWQNGIEYTIANACIHIELPIANSKLPTVNYLCAHEDFNGMPGKYLQKSIGRGHSSTQSIPGGVNVEY
jgi:hypothetical protein